MRLRLHYYDSVVVIEKRKHDSRQGTACVASLHFR
jgi:hypothetical protein